MIKNAKLWALSLSSLLVLTACGGGGGGSSDSGVSVNQPTKPSAVSKLEIDGNIVLIGDNDSKNTQYVKSDDVDVLVVDGKRLLVGILGDTLNQNISPSDKKYDARHEGPGGIYASYAHFGMYKNSDKKNWPGNPAGYGMFYQGYLTPENAVPKTGSITYRSGTLRKNDPSTFGFMKGGVYVAEVLNDGVRNEVHNIASGVDIELTADFDKRELTGFTQSQHGYKQFNTEIYAKIKGNTFAGTKNNVTTEGKFFGPNAESIAGTYHDTSKYQGKNKNIYGVFAADRD